MTQHIFLNLLGVGLGFCALIFAMTIGKAIGKTDPNQMTQMQKSELRLTLIMVLITWISSSVLFLISGAS